MLRFELQYINSIKFAEKEQMAEHNELGKAGEDAAVNYLTARDFVIRHRNWRSGHKELDIVAEKDGFLVVLEVKTRRNETFGLATDAVTDQKIRRIVGSTDAYLRKFNVDLPVRFDVITVIGQKEPFQIEHIEDAFYPPIW